MSELITVWEFRSVDGTQVVRSIRHMYCDDLSYVHEYQTIVYRGPSSGYFSQTQVKELSL